MKNPWVSFIDRNFQQIKSSILNRLTQKVPELEDYSPSNLLMIIIDIFAGVGELINYYIDITARELFVSSAKRLPSLLKIGELVGYYGRGRVAAYATIRITMDRVAPEDFEIPSGSTFKDNRNQTWTSINPTLYREGFYSCEVYVRQYLYKNNISLGESNGESSQIFLLPSEVAHGTLSVEIDGDIWEFVETLGFSGPNDKHFSTKLMPNSQMYLIFGDGVNGKIPPQSETIKISYGETQGESGNINRGSIIEHNIDFPQNFDGVITIDNPDPGYGGMEIEGVEDLRRAIPLVARTLYRAVTVQDYVDIASLAPGVKNVALDFECGKGVSLYIIAHGSGNVNIDLLNSVKDFVLDKSVIGIPVTVYPSGESYVRGTMTIRGKYRVKQAQIISEVRKALEDIYGPYSKAITHRVNTSDIIAAIDNLPSVDSLTLDNMYVQPYLRPSRLESILNYKINILTQSNKVISWRLTCTDSVTGTFNLYRKNIIVKENIQSNELVWILNYMGLIIYPSSIETGDYWDFKTYPPNRDVVLEDKSIPVIIPSDFNLVIKEYNE